MGNLIIKKRNESKRFVDRITNHPSTKRRVVRDEDVKEELLATLTEEEIEDLKELLPYKEALIKIAKGEFEIERIIEEDEDEDDYDIDEEDMDEVTEDEDDSLEVDEDMSDEDEVEVEETEPEDMEDSNAVNEAWKKRLNGNKNV